MNLTPAENSLPRKPKLLERARDILRANYYSRRTEVYLWMRRFILFQDNFGEARIQGMGGSGNLARGHRPEVLMRVTSPGWPRLIFTPL